MKRIIFWGASGQAVVLEEFIETIDYRLIAIFDNNQNQINPFSTIKMYYGKSGFNQWQKSETIDTTDTFFSVAIGGSNGKVREELSKFLIDNELKPTNLIHPSSYIAKNSQLGIGNHILAHSTICARVKIGNWCIINSSSNVDHESIIGNGVHIGPGAKLAGCVKVDDYSFIGTGSIILPRISIGKNSIVGAGSVVTKDIPDGVIAFGNPAKIIKSNNNES